MIEAVYHEAPDPEIAALDESVRFWQESPGLLEAQELTDPAERNSAMQEIALQVVATTRPSRLLEARRNLGHARHYRDNEHVLAQDAVAFEEDRRYGGSVQSRQQAASQAEQAQAALDELAGPLELADYVDAFIAQVQEQPARKGERLDRAIAHTLQSPLFQIATFGFGTLLAVSPWGREHVDLTPVRQARAAARIILASRVQRQSQTG